jgi:hypothetical protein
MKINVFKYKCILLVFLGQASNVLRVARVTFGGCILNVFAKKVPTAFVVLGYNT